MLRESGRDETIGGGEVLDVAPVLPASRARPDRDVDRVVAERGWVDVDELELLTGERRAADGRPLGRRPARRWRATADALGARLAAGGVPLASVRLDERSGPCWTTIDGVVVDATRRPPGRGRRSARRPPGRRRARRRRPGAAGAGRASTAPTLRELARRGVLVERDGLWWHAAAVDDAGALAARLLRDRPAGFTVGEFREAAGITRKHAVPLLAELDASAA